MKLYALTVLSFLVMLTLLAQFFGLDDVVRIASELQRLELPEPHFMWRG